jgi:DNA primase
MNLLNAAQSAGIVLKKVATTKGGEYAGACPSCGGKDRFRCWPEDRGGQGSFWCRQCSKWGDLVQFLVEFRGYTFVDAFKAAGREKPLNYVSKQAGPFLPIHQKRNFEPRIFEGPNDIWQEKAQMMVETSHEYLLRMDDTLKFLEGRGLDMLAIEKFKLGWFPGENNKNCIFRPRQSWGLPEIKKDDGKNKMLWIPRGLIIPCFKGGNIYRIRIRRPKKDLQSKNDIKYYILPGSGMEAMGINPDRKAFIVVESELDGFLIARKAGSLIGVISLGSAQAKPGDNIYPCLKKALTILVALDWDAPGQKAWEWWRDNFRSAKLWPVPIGKDPGEAVEKGLDIKQWIIDGLPPVLTMDFNTNHEIPENLNPPGDLYPIQELEFFLKRLPIKIIADKEKNEVVFDPGLKNQRIKKRVRQLFFDDEEVFYFLKLIHPDSVIHGGNFKFDINSI